MKITWLQLQKQQEYGLSSIYFSFPEVLSFSEQFSDDVYS